MTKMRILALSIGTLVFALDTLSKMWVKNTPWLHYYPVIDGFFTIQYATNEGIAFGWFHDLQSAWKTPVLTSMAVVAVAMVLYYIWTTAPHEKLMFVSLGLLLGGILGNFWDRLMHVAVVDFVKLHWGAKYAWPTFNLADSAITSGVALILLYTFFGNPQDQTVKSEAKEDSAAIE